MMRFSATVFATGCLLASTAPACSSQNDPAGSGGTSGVSPVVGTGGNSGTSAGAGDMSTAGTRSGATGGIAGQASDPACVGAVQDMPCSAGTNVACGDPCPEDVCDACAKLFCKDGNWKKTYLPKTSCFDCTTDDQCISNHEYCKQTGPSLVRHGQCLPIPDSCAASLSCDCLIAENPGDTCSTFDGDYTVNEPPPPGS